MKKALLLLVLFYCFKNGFAQSSNTNTLLWRISGKNLTKPSYLFGTIHMLCGDDIELSDSLKSAIAKADKVYLELDMDNIMEMLGVMNKMKMRNDTTLADLLSPSEYDTVKAFFQKQGGLLPFSLIETYKPMLAASTLMESSLDCDDAIAMEQSIMRQAKRDGVGIKGLETMAYQISIFDSIPYKVQAKQLLSYVENYGKQDDNKELDELTQAYRNQDLQKLEQMTKQETTGSGMEHFADLLLYNRNSNWAKKLDELLPKSTLVIAVGAGHLPGEKGVINLLRKAGYKVEPVENKMFKKKEKEI